ncbi:MAG: flagellar hook protein, partial [Roseburia sp.]|nr:flagellar hook protein [Roseburia sp.]
AETTKFNEIYLLMGDSNGGTKNVFMKGHDAGLKGTLTDSAKSATFVMDELKAGDKVTIAGKEYSIGSTAAEAKALIVDPGNGKSSTVKIDGTEYTLDHTGANL